MKKGIIVGIIVAIIVAGIIGVVSSSNVEISDEPSLEIIDEPSSGQIVVEPENIGRDLSIELAENFGMNSGP